MAPTNNVTTIGITGHIAIRRSCADSLRLFLREFLSQSMGVKSVVTALAPGPDMILAEEALCQGKTVIAALPFLPDLYLRSSSFRSSRDSDSLLTVFERIIQNSQQESVSVPGDEQLSDSQLYKTQEADLQNPERRDMRFRASGEYVVNHSDLLIVASEDPPNHDCRHPGTAAIWAYAVECQVPVIHVPIKRKA